MNMLKRCSILLILALVLCGCAGLSDWSYDQLPGDYEIWRVNSQNIVLGQRDGSTLIHAVDSYIAAFSCNGRFIAVQRLNVDNLEILPGTSIRELGLEPEYWLIDAWNHAAYGPFTADEYREQLTLLDIGALPGWTDTVPAPDGAK